MFLWVLVRMLVNSVSNSSIEMEILLWGYGMEGLWNIHCNINHDHKEMCSRSGMIDTEDIVASVHIALYLAAC